MKKTKTYGTVRFDPEAIIEAKETFVGLVDEESRERLKSLLSASLGEERWDHDSEEELFADIRRGANEYNYRQLHADYDFIVSYGLYGTHVVVALPSRQQVERVFEVIERHTVRCRRPEPEPGEVPSGGPTVFIGHGHSLQWRDLKDHLQDQHGYVVEAYEIGSRAGHTIRDILEEMLSKSSMALLVMTGEDRTEGGTVREFWGHSTQLSWLVSVDPLLMAIAYWAVRHSAVERPVTLMVSKGCSIQCVQASSVLGE